MNEATGSDLAANEVYLWSLPGQRCELDALCRDGFQLLSAEERARSQTFTNRNRARRYLLGRILLRRGLAAHLGTDPAALVIGLGRHGKPILDHPKCADLDFSLSHSARETVLAVARARGIGVDLESWSRAATVLKIGRRFFAAEERHRLDQLGDEAEREALSLWTLKESVIKAVGGTIWSGLSQVSLNCANTVPGWHVSPPAGAAEDWTLALGRFRRDHCLAVALWQSTKGQAPLSWKSHSLGRTKNEAGDLQIVSVSAWT